MKKIANILGIILASTILASCATYNLNKTITGTNCTTRKQCIKDLGLANTPKPDAYFRIEPKDAKNRLGLTGPHYKLFIDVCLAKSLKEAFPESQILWGDENTGDINMGLPLIKISRLRDFGTTFWNGDLEFEGNIDMKSGGTAPSEIKKEIDAYGSHGFLASGKSSVFEGAPTACNDFARKVNKIITRHKLPIISSDSFNLNDFEVSNNSSKCDNSLYLKENNYSTLPGISVEEPVSKLLAAKQVSLLPDGKDSREACYGAHVEVKSLQFREYDKAGAGAILLGVVGGAAGMAIGGPLGLPAFFAGEAIGETSGMVAGAAAGSAMKSFTVAVDAAALIKKPGSTKTRKIAFELNVTDLAGKSDWKEVLTRRISKFLAKKVVTDVFSESERKYYDIEQLRPAQ